MYPLKISTLTASCLIALLIGLGTAAAQNKETLPPPAQTGLSLEVNTTVGPVGYHTVPGSSYGGRYQKLPSWKADAGSPEPQTFALRQEMEGDAVRVKVFALMDRFMEQKVLIGNFLLREGEKAKVEEMAKYGYAPMELSVVRINPAALAVPTVTSKVPSVGVVNIVARQGDFPSYQLTLRNLSSKDINYLEVRTLRNGRIHMIHWPRKEQNLALMKPGETYEVKVDGGDNGVRTSDSYTPTPPQNVEVVAVVFSDQSFEGNRESALTFIAGLRGQKIQLTRALALLQAVTEKTQGGGDARATLASLESEALALGRDARQAYLDELAKEFTELPPHIKINVEGGMDKVRKDFLKEIREYAQTREPDPESKPLSKWLSDLRQKYEAWLSRL